MPPTVSATPSCATRVKFWSAEGNGHFELRSRRKLARIVVAAATRHGLPRMKKEILFLTDGVTICAFIGVLFFYLKSYEAVQAGKWTADRSSEAGLVALALVPIRQIIRRALASPPIKDD